ncbi:unnamed protein product [Notodromas monacha]|uniref:Peptidase M14 domain-containing protein n=1 Tax=Notodromas monacha TaxID=399045 RepID=A0A7R9BY90_9CRUS|nr:unnamed protein product [Notodromas monacha]CAG0923586.1 unnamed protein product [Notodromas monacha]
MSEYVAESKTLSFFGQALKLNSDVDARPVAEKILAANPLEILCLQGCTVGPDAAKEIAKALESKSELQRMQFQDMFTGRLKQEIPQCLRFFGAGLDLAGSHLVELNLSDNAIGPIGSEGLCPILRSQVCYTLKELRLNNTGLGPTGSTMVAEALLDLYNASSSEGRPVGLTVFIAGRSRLENTGAKLFSEVFAKMGTLQELSVPQNGIFPDGIQNLCNALEKNPNLRILNLEDNTVKAVGAKCVATLLRKLEHLEELNLGDGLLKTTGANHLADALQDTPSKLKVLNVSSNEIRLPGGLKIVESLRQHAESLKNVNLDLNWFGDTGAEEVMSRVSEVGVEHCFEPMGENVEPDSDDESENDQAANGGEEDEETSVSFIGPSGKTILAKEVVLKPCVSGLRKLGHSPVPSLFLGMEDAFPLVDTAERDVELIARIADVLPDLGDLKSSEGQFVSSIIKELFAKIFRPVGSSGDASGDDGRQVELLQNHVLVVLGLIKFVVTGKRSALPLPIQRLKSYDGYKLISVIPYTFNQVARLQILRQEENLDFWLGRGQLFQVTEILVSPIQYDRLVAKLRNHILTLRIAHDDIGGLIRRSVSEVGIGFLPAFGRPVKAFSYENFYPSTDIYARMTQLQSQYPTISSVSTIGTSVEGKLIQMMSIDFDGVSSASSKPIVFIEAGIHAREWISPASVMYAMEQILLTGSANSDLSRFDWRIVPISNPDGYDYSHSTDRLWRKNRRVPSSGCVGVDLNRNFGYGWGGKGATTTDTCDETYAGTEAFSEPETQAIRDAVTAVQSRLKFYLSVHSYSQVVLIPYGNTYKLPSDFLTMKKVASGFSASAKKPNNRKYKYGATAWLLYPASGTSDDWAKSLGIHTSLAVELPPKQFDLLNSYGFISPASDIIPVGKEVLEGLKGAVRAIK